MTDFASIADIRDAMATCCGVGCPIDFTKASLTTAGGYAYSLFRAGGAPGTGSPPTSWASPNALTAGAINPKHTQPLSGKTARILRAELYSSQVDQTAWLVDRIGHMGAMSGTVTTAQSTGASISSPAAEGRCAADGSDVQWWLEWYVATGTNAVNASCAVTFSDNSTGNLVVAVPAAMQANRMIQILNTIDNRTIKTVDSVTLSGTTGTGGNFGVTALVRKIAFMSAKTMNNGSGDLVTRDATAPNWFRADAFALGLPALAPNACCCLVLPLASTTSSGTFVGSLVVGVA